MPKVSRTLVSSKNLVHYQPPATGLFLALATFSHTRTLTRGFVQLDINEITPLPFISRLGGEPRQNLPVIQNNTRAEGEPSHPETNTSWVPPSCGVGIGCWEIA